MINQLSQHKLEATIVKFKHLPDINQHSMENKHLCGSAFHLIVGTICEYRGATVPINFWTYIF